MFIVYLSQGLLLVTAFFTLLRTVLLNYVNWLRTSSDVEVGFNYPI
jgi:hypothetical protein